MPVPKLKIETPTLDFGIVPSYSSTDKKLTIKNDGDPGSLLSGSISVPAYFSFVGRGTLGNGATMNFSSIRAGGSQTFDIRVVNPRNDPQVGNRTEKATVTSNGGNGTADLKVDFRLRRPR